jgi:sugar lactone lactonase YvrE
VRSTPSGLVHLTCLAALAVVSCNSSGSPQHVDAGELQRGLELLAGAIGGPGGADGSGAAARFNFPTGVAVDGASSVYVADQRNQTIRKITPDGVVTTLAGAAGMSGSVDGTGAAARFNFPTGVAVDGAGNIYVADRGSSTIRKVTAAGVVTTLAGTAGMSGTTDGTGAAARFKLPTGVTVDGAGNVYVADSGSGLVRKVTPAGVVTTMPGAAGFVGIAVDGVGNVYVAAGCMIQKIAAGGGAATPVGDPSRCGASDDPGEGAPFNSLAGLAVDGAGNMYVADRGSHSVRKVTPAGVVTTLAGTARLFGRADGAGPAARFRFPSGIAIDAAGTLYVADQGNHIIRKVTSSGAVTTLAGTSQLAGSVDGTGVTARLSAPASTAVDGAGNIYVADRYNHTLRKITPTGAVTTLAGSAGAAGSTDGAGGAARFKMPTGVALDGAGSLYVSDQFNHTLRKVTAAGAVTTLAGAAGLSGSVDGPGAMASFRFPAGVAVDSAGNVYVADQGNLTIRKVTAAGAVTTLAGTAGMAGSVDGMGAAARFSRPSDMAIDGAGNLYVTDEHAIRKITAAGEVTTLAGIAGTAGSDDGAGAAARFHFPAGLAVDSAGNVYVADRFNDAIRKITPDGTTTTLAGIPGQAGILLGATPRLAFPQGLAIVGDSLVITDADAVLLLRHGCR